MSVFEVIFTNSFFSILFFGLIFFIIPILIPFALLEYNFNNWVVFLSPYVYYIVLFAFLRYTNGNSKGIKIIEDEEPQLTYINEEEDVSEFFLSNDNDFLGNENNNDANLIAKIRMEEIKKIVSPDTGIDWEDIYRILSILLGFLTFIGSYIYCIFTYGFLLGVGLGWLPAAICAVLVGFLWPIILIALLLIFLFIRLTN